MTDTALYANLVVPRHMGSFSLTHNEQKDVYETAYQRITNNPEYYAPDTWVKAGEDQIAISTDSIWTAHWYPDTPVGFNVLHAATLPALLERLWELENVSARLGPEIAPKDQEQ